MTAFRERMDAEGDKLVNLVNSFSLPTYQKPYRRWNKKNAWQTPGVSLCLTRH